MGYLIEAIRSIEQQTYPDVEVITVVDGGYELYKTVKTSLCSEKLSVDLRIVRNQGPRGLSTCRNIGVACTNADIVCFLDDDAVAHEKWIEELVRIYSQYPRAIGVGGPLLPLGEIPWWIPKGFYWLLGVNQPEALDSDVVSVRNLYGSNMSFRREVFSKVGEFRCDLGLKGTTLLQAEEAEFCIRCLKALNGIILFNPRAIVYHRILPHRLKPSYLYRRAFYQGYSKALLGRVYGLSVLNTERRHLKEVLKALVKPSLSLREWVKKTVSATLTLTVGLGFLWGLYKS